MTGLGVKIAGYDIRQDQETFEIVISRGPMFVYSEIVDRRFSFSELQKLLFEKVGRVTLNGLRIKDLG